MATLKLQTNVPEVIALAFADGMPVSSQFGGDQVLYTLVDGRKMYLAPAVADKITAAGIEAGELFSICKRERVVGNRRIVSYEIDNTVAGASNAPAPAPPAPAPRSNVTPIAGANALAPAASPDLAVVEFMKLAGRAAVDAVLEIESYARSRGMTDFLMGADNIQRIAVSLYIDMRKGGRA